MSRALIPGIIAALIAATMISFLASAEISSFSLNAKVKAFDETSATLESEGHIFKAKRTDIQQKNFHSGDTVLVTLHGKDIEALAKSPELKTAVKK